jgi:predicted HTH transcriptional regulator
MFDLFAVSWGEVELEHVESFLAQADEEGVNWEAKAEGEDAPLHPGSIRKAACGLANQIGGYLILGARKSTGRSWELSGIATKDEPKLWIGQILRGLRPTPRFDIRS